MMILSSRIKAVRNTRLDTQLPQLIHKLAVVVGEYVDVALEDLGVATDAGAVGIAICGFTLGMVLTAGQTSSMCIVASDLAMFAPVACLAGACVCGAGR